MRGDRLGARALNRATLSRQLLLGRDDRPVLAAVEHLVGLQAQVPLDPYTGLWSRLAAFRPEQLGRLLESRAVVRTTVYLVRMSDFGEMNGIYAKRFGSHRPARSTVAVAELPKGAAIEIDAIARLRG